MKTRKLATILTLVLALACSTRIHATPGRRGSTRTAAGETHGGATPLSPSIFQFIAGLKLQFENSRLVLEMENGHIIITRIVGQLGGGTVEVRGHLDASDLQGRQFAKITVKNVQLDHTSVLASLGLPNVSEAPLTGELNLAWNGWTVDEVARTLEGKARVEAGSGSFKTPTALSAVGQLAGFSGETVSFNHGLFEVEVHRGGTADIKTCRLDGGEVQLDSRGMANLVRCDVIMQCKVCLAATGGSGSAMGKLSSMFASFAAMPEEKQESRQRMIAMPPFTVSGKPSDFQIKFGELQAGQ